MVAEVVMEAVVVMAVVKKPNIPQTVHVILLGKYATSIT